LDKNTREISICGGDLRICMLAELLACDGYKVHTYAIEEMDIPDDLKERIIIHEEISEISKLTDIIISSIPLSRDEVKVYTPFSKKAVSIDKLFENISRKNFYCRGSREICV